MRSPTVAHTHERRTSTRRLEIPRCDWAKVRAGEKTEVRYGAGCLRFQRDEMPVLVAAHSKVSYRAELDWALLVVTAAWTEPLGALSDESLAREGFTDRREFKRYWQTRDRRGEFHWLTKVAVLRLRPWQPQDTAFFADRLLRRLYGEWLPDDPASA